MSRSKVLAGLVTSIVAVVLAICGPAAYATAKPITAKPIPIPTTGDSFGLSSADDALLHRQAKSGKELRRQLALQLKIAPGGKQTAANEITYGDGRFVVTYALPSNTVSAALAPDCPSGWFCFYDGTNYGYPRGKLSDCGWQDLATWRWNDRTSSLHNRTSSRVDYSNHFDYGNPANGHIYDYFLFANYAGQALPTVPNNNTADHVYRYC